MATPGRATGRVTLADVAERVGVSRATVSLVLRGRDGVSEATRERVRGAMGELGYVYDRNAASMRTQHSMTVGLVVTDMTNPFFAELTVGMEAELDAAGYVALLGHTGETFDKQQRLLRTMGEYRVDGLLLCPARGTSPAILRSLAENDQPVVLVARYLAEVDTDYAGADNVQGAISAVEHLLEHGHERIAFVGGPPDSSARRDRLHGRSLALEAAGVSVEAGFEVQSPVTRQGGYEAMLEVLRRRPRPTAVLCYNDVVAFGVLRALQSLGMTPGVDCAVVGFDDVEEAALHEPALTTVATSPRDIGVCAARLLLDRLKDPGRSPAHVEVPASLAVRESCGCQQPGGAS